MTLRNGSYELYCPVDGHKGLGMDVRVTVGGGAAARSQSEHQHDLDHRRKHDVERRRLLTPKDAEGPCAGPSARLVVGAPEAG